ncbi:hypothetical protein GCM10011507_25990 [Edaphobacter acidisoli]|uniref:Protein-glutamine gamma-glutamyltransferase-like C-terminal domain-containing protein n=1 Tax=Edaphobacter acidisoli TaxID=2040573 RepID=A0A916RWV5_9BACT|nr:DUF4129 domain-containing protein [Edaphobacter acidisoli]GGA73181.1 hypothetical protein GCM10011507_25990 [Edaphobacter acidisoli]
MRFAWLIPGALGIAVLSCGRTCVAAPAAPGSTISSFADYTAHLDSLREVILLCRNDAAQCQSSKVGADQRIEPEGFTAKYGWLRDAIDRSKDKALKDRDAILDSALTRVGVEESEAHQNADAAGFDNARRVANDILATPEFQRVQGPSWWEQKELAFWRWADRLFGDVSDAAGRNPWLRPVILWGMLVLAIAGLFVWARRAFQRQRFVVRVEGQGTSMIASGSSPDWTALAQQYSAEENWREAVHCLYWASIVMLEGRGIWRRGVARTPREYLLLLRSGSAQQTALRQLTSLFERVWYGKHPIGKGDYNSALALFDALRSA